MSPPLPICSSPSEWIRICAAHLAQRRPDTPAEEVLQLAIARFRQAPHLVPEAAAAQLM